MLTLTRLARCGATGSTLARRQVDRFRSHWQVARTCLGTCLKTCLESMLLKQVSKQSFKSRFQEHVVRPDLENMYREQLSIEHVAGLKLMSREHVSRVCCLIKVFRAAV